MAINETDNLNIAITSITAQGVEEIGRVAFLSRASAPSEGDLLEIPTTGRTIVFGPPPPKFVYIRNMPTSIRDLLVDSVSTFDAFPQRVRPDRSICICPQGDTIYLAGQYGACRAWIMTDTTMDISSFVPPPSDSLYIQFSINWHDAGSINNGTDPLNIGESDLINGNYVSVYPQSGQWTFWSNASPYNFSQVGASALDTWQTIGMKLRNDSGEIFLTPRVDGTEYSEFDAGAFSIQSLAFGAILSGSANNFVLDDLTIGTSSWGASDIFSANFSGHTIVPPFDSTGGAGSGMDASSGSLSIVNGGGYPGGDTYGLKSIIWP